MGKYHIQLSSAGRTVTVATQRKAIAAAFARAISPSQGAAERLEDVYAHASGKLTEFDAPRVHVINLNARYRS